MIIIKNSNYSVSQIKSSPAIGSSHAENSATILQLILNISRQVIRMIRDPLQVADDI